MPRKQTQASVVNVRNSSFGVYIGRQNPRIDRDFEGGDGYFGNPFILESDSPAARKKCLRTYFTYFSRRLRADQDFADRVRSLEGKVLGCWCVPKACHGDVICQYLNREGPVWEAISAMDAQLGAKQIRQISGHGKGEWWNAWVDGELWLGVVNGAPSYVAIAARNKWPEMIGRLVLQHINNKFQEVFT